MRETRPGPNGPVTLTTYMWGMLESAYRAAGLDPGAYLVVTQGSFRAGGGADASGSTHDKAGAADLRTWNLPGWARESLCKALVVPLRERNGCAWYRDQAHGGMDPHIHVILRDDVEALSSGARSQVTDYDASRNGLSNKGPDYHPRPKQRPWGSYGDTTTGDDDDVFIFQTNADGDGKDGGGAHYIVIGTKAVQCDKGYTTSPDVLRVLSSTEAMDNAFYAAVTRYKL
jgi:hypothetical protein